MGTKRLGKNSTPSEIRFKVEPKLVNETQSPYCVLTHECSSMHNCSHGIGNSTKQNESLLFTSAPLLPLQRLSSNSILLLVPRREGSPMTRHREPLDDEETDIKPIIIIILWCNLLVGVGRILNIP